MHLNPFHPNILHDMQAAANGRDLRDGQRTPLPHGKVMVLTSAKHHLIPRNSYSYSSDRQVKRQQDKFEVLFNRAYAEIEAKA